jgi:PAS domain S-box-containing protein
MSRYPLREITDLQVGDHLCCIYETEEEHRKVLAPFLAQGLERNERVLYIVDARAAETILGYLREDGVDVEAYCNQGQLTIFSANEAYMRDGVFDPDRMIALLRAETQRALEDGYSALRVTGEMSWALRGLPGSERLMEYEAKLNTFLPESKCLAICQYDRRLFDAEVLLDVLTTHPYAVIGARLLENFYYMPPEDFLGKYTAEARLRRCVDNLIERRRAEKRLRLQAQLLDSVREAVVGTDLEGRILYWSKGAEGLYGYQSGEIVSTIQLVPEPHVHEERERMRLVSSVGMWNGEYLLQRKNGSLFWAHTVISLVSDESGQPSGFIRIDRDVTQRKIVEEALQKTRGELETRVEERTAELVRANRRLQKSEEDLRFLSAQLLTVEENERGRIARELHDGVGQSLSAIKFKMEDALSHLSHAAGDSARPCIMSLESLIPLLQNTMEEVRSITMDLRPSTLDDLGILATMAWYCREFQKLYSSIRIETEIAAAETEVRDPLKIVVYRVLQEALNNVAKHSRANMVRLCLTRQDDTIELSIEDDGIGFDIGAALSREASERGFGLRSMRERVELSGGSFALESTRGTGTAIRAAWPIGPSPAAPES